MSGACKAKNERLREKHPELAPDPAIVERIRKDTQEGRISCAACFKIAEDLGRTPAEVGAQVDLEGIRLVDCCMGIFGIHHIDQPQLAPGDIRPDLAAAVRAALNEKGYLTCAAGWRVADELKVPRVEVTRACNALGIHISECQLGAFP